MVDKGISKWPQHNKKKSRGLPVIAHGQNGFWSVQRKTNFFAGFSSVFAFKQLKTYFVAGATFKNVIKTFFSSHFRVTAQIFKGLATKERGNIKT